MTESEGDDHTVQAGRRKWFTGPDELGSRQVQKRIMTISLVPAELTDV
jgi:hypothetical protein